ncbi:nucleotide pyrophosphatase [Enterococcus canis]|uniref:Nucleotide pyrophosphatase n=2 Tax=Enterococcus canis TaxID=214095 RepID=A0A1L8RHY0_9ENTE|nr:ectonucleotide pyrophosphatase/phosphodiesterase [Enterococcus canis]OJG19302.1 nucleotide pyrophosphatase [Enterococcus canis]
MDFLKKMVIISVDAMGASDLVGDLADTPTFEWLRREGTHIQNIEAIYPSLTYPSHTTLVTGEYPKTHGVINNTKIQSNRMSPDWYWYKKDVLVPTLYELAQQAGMTTAAFLWPVTAKSGIDYNIAEIFPNRIWTNQVLVSLNASSPRFLLEMNHKYGHLRQGIKQPYLDDFITACAVDTLVTKKPDLTLIHLVDMDSMRHAHGVLSPEAEAAFLRQDRRIKDIINATKQAGTFDETVFVVLGDHYQIDVNKMIRLNHLFAEKGWSKVKKDGTIQANWQVYAKSCDGSCYIYVDQKASVNPAELFKELEKVEGVAKVYSTEEATAQGAAPNVTFMVEAKRGYYFIDDAAGPVNEPVNSKDIGQPERYRAVHGYSPQKQNYKTTVLFFGPGIRSGKVIDQARLIDEAPTFAKILGLTFPNPVAGQVLHEVFEREEGEPPSEVLE